MRYLVILLAGLVCGCRPPATEPAPSAVAPVAVQLATLQKGEATQSIALPANIQAFQQVTLYAKVAGYARTVAVDRGDAVEAGALLAEIEVPELLADRAKYRAELEVAELDYNRANQAQTKAPDLVMPQAVDSARGRAAIAKANLERTETLLGFAKITAPFAGVITKRTIDPGAFIPAATSANTAQSSGLFTVMDFSKVRVQISIPEMEVPRITNGLPVKLTVEELPGRQFEGRITRYGHALEEATRTMAAEVELPNPAGTLRPGMYGVARIMVERKPDALVLPTEALVVEKNRSSVFVMADHKARRVTVKTGFSDGGKVEIVEGLSLGDPVIVVGKQVLTDGQPVTTGAK